MIQIIPIRYDGKSRNSSVRTHILTPDEKVTVNLIVEGKKENIVSIIEDHILETISGIEWDSRDSESDFKFLTENYNRFIRNLDSEDLSDISVAISFLKGNILTISTIGQATAYLVEGDEITKIASPEKGRFDFHTLTEGEVSRNASIYISHLDLIDTLGGELLVEFSDLTGQDFKDEVEQIFSRELDFPLHLVRVAHSFKNVQAEIRQRGRGQLDLLKNKSTTAVNYVKNLPIWDTMKEKINSVDFKENSRQKYAYLGTGIVIIFFLVIIGLQALSNAITSVSDPAREQVLQAQTLIDESAKLSGNSEAFSEKIREAENILFSLRNEQKYLADIETLQGKIQALKKEMYNIQTINLSEKKSLLPVEGSDFVPLFTFELNNKLSVVGKKGFISDFVRGNSLPKILEYPNSDEAIDAAVNDSGIPFIITNSKKIVTRDQNVMKYSLVNGQESWETGHEVISFNGSIYLVNTDRNQIYSHKPVGKNFNAKTNVLPELFSSKISSLAIDGGFYIIGEDGRVYRYVRVNEGGVKSLVLNKIPGAWNLNMTDGTQIVASSTLSYVYIRNGKNIWVFEPNSKSFRDINALSYIAQLEIQSNENISDLSVPRDGIFYITTEKGVFETNFEISDSKLILK